MKPTGRAASSSGEQALQRAKPRIPGCSAKKARSMLADAMPLFVCHANCARSVLAAYLYRHLCGDAPVASAGLVAGPEINDRVLSMLRRWGIDASGHCPRQLDRELCDRADAIFVMGPPYLARLLRDYGPDLAGKAYLFADPFTRPVSFARGEYIVYDPSFDHRSVRDLVREFGWMRERVLQIGLALLGEGRPLVPAREYPVLLCSVDPSGR
jgi:protein-tyrosine-phosphatase